MLKWRLLLGSLMILLLAGLLTVDLISVGAGWQFGGAYLISAGLIPTVLATVLGCLAAVELLKFAGRWRCEPHKLLAIIATAALTVQPLLARLWPGVIPSRADILVAAVILAWSLQIFYRKKIEAASLDLAWTMLTILYAGLLASYAVGIRSDFGPVHFIFLLAVTKSGDIGAYFTGITCGRRKLIAWLSPGKTWEGLAGALVAGGAVGGLVAHLASLSHIATFNISVPLAILLGVLTSAAGHLGDLAESLLKRDAQQKDSSCLLPAFGGVLDLADSVLFAAAVLYLSFFLIS